MAVKHSELQSIYEQLSAPLQDSEVEWRIDSSPKDGYPGNVRVVPYVKHDVVVERLHRILGFGNWSFEIERSERNDNGTTIARLTIHTDEGAVVFMDLADDKDSGNLKGSATRSLPRVVRFLGLGSELYRLNTVWGYAESKYKFSEPSLTTELRKAGQPTAQSQRPVEPAPPANVTPIRNTNGYLFAAIGDWNDFHEYTGDDKENKRKDFATAKGFHVKSFADLTDPQRIELALLFKQDLVLQMARKRPGDFSLDKEAELVKWASNTRADAKLIGDLTALECDKILAAWDDAKQETA